jgi:hypothetical protein
MLCSGSRRRVVWYSVTNCWRNKQLSSSPCLPDYTVTLHKTLFIVTAWKPKMTWNWNVCIRCSNSAV